MAEQALHNTIEATLRAEKLDQWQCGADVINELITLGANPSKLDDKGRSALAVMKEYPLVPDDLRNGKEDIVSFSFLFFFFFFVLHAVHTNVRTCGAFFFALCKHLHRQLIQFVELETSLTARIAAHTLSHKALACVPSFTPSSNHALLTSEVGR